jgi:hypothetical protein
MASTQSWERNRPCVPHSTSEKETGGEQIAPCLFFLLVSRAVLLRLKKATTASIKEPSKARPIQGQSPSKPMTSPDVGLLQTGWLLRIGASRPIRRRNST